MVGVDSKRIIHRIPYIGLDIESIDRGSIRVEYSPNRPDFGTDFGIARALRGLLGKEVGLPRFPTRTSGVSVSVDRRLSTVRPHIACAVASGLSLDGEDVRQIISLQEDLHNGLGRKRKVAAIGLHDLDKVKPPLRYQAVDSSFQFTPLGAREPMSVASVLSNTSEGRVYGPALAGSKLFPLITDSRGTVLSFPPIINGAVTKVTTKAKNLLVDVTSTDRRAGDDVLAIIATTLAAAGGRLGTVSIRYPGSTRVTPDLEPSEIPLDPGFVMSVLGLDLSGAEMAKSLARSRLGVKRSRVLAPRYRVDLLHPVDVAEEVAIGYGFDRVGPVYPPSEKPGSFNDFDNFLDSTSTIMVGEGMIEMMTYELTDEESLYGKFQRPSSGLIRVQNPKSLEHAVLRDALLPTLMASLSANVRSDYPQRVFEIGRVYSRTAGGVSEAWHLGCCVAHSQSSYTEAKMYLDAACRTITGREPTAKEGKHWAFVPGRSAKILVEGKDVGHVGEMGPDAIGAFGLGVPVSGFEVDLSLLYELLK
jgi:phenylalanyl-tRNA synthetase beta chain